MIDNLSILLSHLLIALAFWYLTLRDDVDHEERPAPDAEPEGFGHAIRKRPASKVKDTPDA
ncbi:MAG: hypothetical protein ABL928_09115 [Sphingorhabdus sp.]